MVVSEPVHPDSGDWLQPSSVKALEKKLALPLCTLGVTCSNCHYCREAWATYSVFNDLAGNTVPNPPRLKEDIPSRRIF